MADSIAKRVIDVLARSQKRDPATISEDMSFADLGIDSLDGLRIIFELEEEFGVEIPEAEMKRYTTVAAAIDGMTRLLDPETSA